MSQLDEPSHLPLRMLNEFAYCPRLFHLMHVEGRWADNAFTEDGRRVHRRVDRVDHALPDAAPPGSDPDHAGPAAEAGDDKGDAPPAVVRSVPLASDTLGLTAKLDLVSLDDQPAPGRPPEAVPVDTKRGRVPDTPERCYEPERVQLMGQGLLLREHGYHCDHGMLYFAASRTKVLVPFTDALEARTRQLLREAHAAAQTRAMPEPLVDSPKCVGCSLNGICLPDETHALRSVPADPASLTTHQPPLRRLYPARDHALPLYVQEQGAYVRKRGERLVVTKKNETLTSLPLKDVSQLVLCGQIGVSTPTVHLLCEAEVPIVYLSMGHWFYGITHGITLRNAYDRAAQFEAAADPRQCLAIARQLVLDKGANQRALLRRNAKGGASLRDALEAMAQTLQQAQQAPTLAALLGYEGTLATQYFSHFASMLKPRELDTTWDFNKRNRRPPRDPVNAMLSFLYAILAKECTVALLAEGLDPYWGFYHQPRHGRPALALDLMEPLRPSVADSALITAVNTGMIDAGHFERTAAACMLNAHGRKAMLRAYESRLDQLITHPLFDYRCTWRQIIRLQARLLARYLRGDVPTYRHVVVR